MKNNTLLGSMSFRSGPRTTRAKSSYWLKESCNINIKEFLKKDPKKEVSVIDQINQLYLKKDFSNMKFDLKETLSNNGCNIVPTTIVEDDGQKGFMKPLAKDANVETHLDSSQQKKARKRRLKSGNPLLKHSKENNLMLFSQKPRKQEKKLTFIDKMVARSYLYEIKSLSVDPKEALDKMKQHKETLKEQLTTRKFSHSESLNDTMLGDLKNRVLQSVDKTDFEEFKKNLEPTAVATQAGARALFLRYNKNPMNSLRQKMVKQNKIKKNKSNIIDTEFRDIQISQFSAGALSVNSNPKPNIKQSARSSMKYMTIQTNLGVVHEEVKRQPNKDRIFSATRNINQINLETQAQKQRPYTGAYRSIDPANISASMDSNIFKKNNINNDLIMEQNINANTTRVIEKGVFDIRTQKKILQKEEEDKAFSQQMKSQKVIRDLFCYGQFPKSNLSSHVIKVEDGNKKDQEQTLDEITVENIYKQRCLDCGHNFKAMKPQFEKFKQYVAKNCVNRKIVLDEMALSFNFAKYLGNIVQTNVFKIARIEIGKNFLRDKGIIEFSKCLKMARSLVHFDVSSNEISPKGILALSDAIQQCPSLVSLNLSTTDGIQRNRLSREGGFYIGNVLKNPKSMLQMINLNNTCLGDQGLNFILRAIQFQIRGKDIEQLLESQIIDRDEILDTLEDEKIVLGRNSSHEPRQRDHITKALKKAQSVMSHGKQFSAITNDPFSIPNLLSDKVSAANMGILISTIADNRNKTESLVQVLELQRNDIKFSEHTAVNLNNVLQNGNLQILDISYNHLGDSGIQKLSIGLQGKVSLQKLYMIDCKFGIPGCQDFFENMGINGSIIELKIDQNKIGRQELENEKLDGTEYVTSFKEFFSVNQTLRKLSMSKCQLGDMAITKFSHGLAINSSLKELNLKENNINDDGACELASAFQNTKVRLTHLYLNKNFIKDRGAKALAHAIRNLQPQQRTLKVLDFTDNSIGPDGAFYLAEQLRFNPQLIFMSINLNINIPYSLLVQLKQQLKLNKMFQEINHVPNLIKETEFLKERTNLRNFSILQKKHEKAKVKFIEMQKMVMNERKLIANDKIKQLNFTQSTEKELKEIDKMEDKLYQEMNQKNAQFIQRGKDLRYKVDSTQQQIKSYQADNLKIQEQLNQFLKVLNNIKKDQKHRMRDDIKELKKAQVTQMKAKEKFEEAQKSLEFYKLSQAPKIDLFDDEFDDEKRTTRKKSCRKIGRQGTMVKKVASIPFGQEKTEDSVLRTDISTQKENKPNKSKGKKKKKN